MVTNDKHTVHRDQVLPKVQDSILKIEDPTGYLNIKNSVTISAEPIPPSRPNADAQGRDGRRDLGQRGP